MPSSPKPATRASKPGSALLGLPGKLIRAAWAAVRQVARLLAEGTVELARTIGGAVRWLVGLLATGWAIARSLPARARNAPATLRARRAAAAATAAIGPPHGPYPDRSLRARLEALGARTRTVLTVFWRSVLAFCCVAMMAAAVLHSKGNQPLSAQVVLISFTLAVAMVPVGLLTELLTPREEKL